MANAACATHVSHAPPLTRPPQPIRGHSEWMLIRNGTSGIQANCVPSAFTEGHKSLRGAVTPRASLSIVRTAVSFEQRSPRFCHKLYSVSVSTALATPAREKKVPSQPRGGFSCAVNAVGGNENLKGLSLVRGRFGSSTTSENWCQTSPPPPRAGFHGQGDCRQFFLSHQPGTVLSQEWQQARQCPVGDKSVRDAVMPRTSLGTVRTAVSLSGARGFAIVWCEYRSRDTRMGKESTEAATGWVFRTYV